MTRILFRDGAGRPLAGASVAITSAPGEMSDIGYITDDAGAIALTVPAAGSYGFTLSAPDGGNLTASTQLDPDGEAEVTALATG